VIVPGELLFVEETPEKADAKGSETYDRNQDAEQAFFAAGTVAIEVNEPELNGSHAWGIAAAESPQDLVEEGHAGGDYGVGAEVELGEAKLDAAEVINCDQNADADGDHGHVVGDSHRTVCGDCNRGVDVEGSFDGASFHVFCGEGELLLDLEGVFRVERLVALSATCLGVAFLGGAGRFGCVRREGIEGDDSFGFLDRKKTGLEGLSGANVL